MSHRPAKWPLRRTFGFLLIIAGTFWTLLGLALKLLLSLQGQ